MKGSRYWQHRVASVTSLVTSGEGMELWLMTTTNTSLRWSPSMMDPAQSVDLMSQGEIQQRMPCSSRWWQMASAMALSAEL
ncbi:MAG: hypothetical protein IJ751_07065 [Oscillospiraceae bacterium]|nr:hypothetical protein [Oscillospiraceae bacterium]